MRKMKMRVEGWIPEENKVEEASTKSRPAVNIFPSAHMMATLISLSSSTILKALPTSSNKPSQFVSLDSRECLVGWVFMLLL